jgi:hypothetical protein
MWGTMKLGGNTIANTSGVLIADGKEIIALERGEGDLQLLLSIEIFDQEGRHIAKLRRNAWAFPDGGERYAITTNPGALTLTDTETGRVVVGAKVLGRNEVEVDRGDFYPERDGDRRHAGIARDRDESLHRESDSGERCRDRSRRVYGDLGWRQRRRAL